MFPFNNKHLLLLLLLAVFTSQAINAQTLIMDECFGDDLSGKLHTGNPDDISFPGLSPDNLSFYFTGCLVPSVADYDDLFSFQVPEGFELESIQFRDIWPLFENLTAVNFYFWFGDDCQPIFSPDLSAEGYMYNVGEGPTSNLIASLDLPLGPGWYSGWVDMNALPSSTTYELIFTFSCNDHVKPDFTTAAGELDRTIECTDGVGMFESLELAPEGFDLGGGEVEITMVSDVTTPSPQCANAYTRVRTWQIEDACGNVGLNNYVQTIEVSDNLAPVAFPKVGEISITDAAGYVFTEDDVIDMESAFDQCGGEVHLVSINPAMVTCAQLNTTVPVTVTVADDCGNARDVITQIEVKEDTGIHSPWYQTDIGATAAGDAERSVCAGTYTVSSKGFSVPQSDVTHMVYVQICGDGELTARVSQLNPVGGWAGIMVRENLSQGSKKLALKTALNNTIRRDVRMAANGVAQTQQSVIVPGPVWFRITRTGNNFLAYASPNGTSWSPLGSVMLGVGNCVYLGLFVESTNNNLEITGTFDNVTVSGGVQALMAPDPGMESFITENPASKTSTSIHNPTTVGTTIKVYPNPTAGVFQLELGDFAGKDLTVQLMDAVGKVVHTQNLSAASATESFDLSGFSPGIYYLSVVSPGQTPTTTRLVVTRP